MGEINLRLRELSNGADGIGEGPGLCEVSEITDLDRRGAAKRQFGVQQKRVSSVPAKLSNYFLGVFPMWKRYCCLRKERPYIHVSVAGNTGKDAGARLYLDQLFCKTVDES
jgi:hypothetical protein